MFMDSADQYNEVLTRAGYYENISHLSDQVVNETKQHVDNANKLEKFGKTTMARKMKKFLKFSNRNECKKSTDNINKRHSLSPCTGKRPRSPMIITNS